LRSFSFHPEFIDKSIALVIEMADFPTPTLYMNYGNFISLNGTIQAMKGDSELS